MDASSHRAVRYFVDDTCTALDFEEGHVMRPVRVRLTHSLVRSLGLDTRLQIYNAPRAQPDELLEVHSPAFVSFLLQAEKICEDPTHPTYVDAQRLYGADCRQTAPHCTAEEGADCPLFPGVWELVSSCCGASLAAARSINSGEVDVAINWAGGLHHAMPTACSGFCYANDIALCIYELLRKHNRVLYIDIDAHHGDGVEHVFAADKRVMTLSIHQFGEGFFPGTGSMADVGTGEARGFALNLPIPPNTCDEEYLLLLRVALGEAASTFDPDVCVLQCGADTIYGDPIGQLRVSTYAFAEAARLVLEEIGRPTVILGGGGYHVTNTARAWSIITAVAVGAHGTLPSDIPSHDPYYYPHYSRVDPLTLAADPSSHIHAPPLHVSVPPRKALSPGSSDSSSSPSKSQLVVKAPGGRKIPQPNAAVDSMRALEQAILSHVHDCMRHVRLARWGLTRTLKSIQFESITSQSIAEPVYAVEP